MIVLVVLYARWRQSKQRLYKEQFRNSLQEQKETTEQLSVQNKFIATLTHEIRNFVTK